MIAPILLPIITLLGALFTSGAPIAEWDVNYTSSGSHTLHIDLHVRTSGDVSVGRLTLQPHGWSNPDMRLNPSQSSPNKSWTQGPNWHWMWEQAPSYIHMDLEAMSPDSPQAQLDVVWEQVRQGKREKWTLGSIQVPNPTAASTQPTLGDLILRRKARVTDFSSADIELIMGNIQPGSFLKWSEHIPETCTCEVLDAQGATLRRTSTSQIFMWFESPTGLTQLNPRYRVQCPHDFDIRNAAFDGVVDVSFGTTTKSSHIAEVEWDVSKTDQNENMELNPALAVAGNGVSLGTSPAMGVTSNVTPRFAVQLLAVHRDLSPAEVAQATGYAHSTHIERNEDWRKYLTDDVTTYAAAHDLRDEVWSSTRATDAFVTASLDGERITVQEALLMSNQTWIP
ncbi:MAG: hypothetical protein O3B70_00530 [Bacteroidetes bacterium]|nr:hypothetical protein [Bacteroidota bacterium]MDA0902800.1 hypothetical protein [Bacteroidota bacterium]MDA1242047.1 hypothetical protein [Bacteroidota bacterium]